MPQENNTIAEIFYRKIKNLENDIVYQLDKVREASNLVSEHTKKVNKWKETIDKLENREYNHFIIDTELTTFILKLDDVELKKDNRYHFTGIIGVFSINDYPMFIKYLTLKISDIQNITPITAEQFKDLTFEAILENNRDVLKRLKD
jgi:uncharacterized coiled-coil protein SlyX